MDDVETADFSVRCRELVQEDNSYVEREFATELRVDVMFEVTELTVLEDEVPVVRSLLEVA